MDEEYISRSYLQNKDINEPADSIMRKNELNISIVIETINTACRFICLYLKRILDFYFKLKIC